MVVSQMLHCVRDKNMRRVLALSLGYLSVYLLFTGCNVRSGDINKLYICIICTYIVLFLLYVKLI